MVYRTVREQAKGLSHKILHFAAAPVLSEIDCAK